MKHFLRIADLSAQSFVALIDAAKQIKRDHYQGKNPKVFQGKTLAMIFAKPSTRTRVSFEAGFYHLGGHAMFLQRDALQLSRNESIEDTAMAVTSMVDMVMIRTFEQAEVERFAAVAKVPVINGLTDTHHPCEIIADMQTFSELRGDIAGRKVAYMGDGNNILNSYIEASYLLKFELVHAGPDGYEPDQAIVAQYGRNYTKEADPVVAVRGADLIVTDVWASMGDTGSAARNMKFSPYQVNRALIAQASTNVLFLHCLPANRGEEVDEYVLHDACSGVWHGTENRLHSQKALMISLREALIKSMMGETEKKR